MFARRITIWKVNDFQFFMLNEWKASKREIYATKCLGENTWRWLAHLVSRFACNGGDASQIHRLCDRPDDFGGRCHLELKKFSPT